MSAGPREPADRELALAHNQLALYARDLKRLLEEERRHRQELEDAYRDTVHRLIAMTKLRDLESGSHLERISLYVEAFAEVLELPFQMRFLPAASSLHDVGKVGIPRSILFKAGRLNAEETRLMQQHTTMGAQMLGGSPSPVLRLAAEVALSHHERWNGAGYPAGLRGAEIPLSGRIVAFADQYDALRSDRPYRTGCDHEVACSTILLGDGRTHPEHFDPELLDVFQDLHPRFAEIWDGVVPQSATV